MKMSFGRVMAVAAVPVLLLALGAGSASAQVGSGNPPPPAGFEADSASFVSASTGFVLGARGCSRMPCKARLDKTTDGGAHWAAALAPAVKLVQPFTVSPRSSVSTVRFENASDGWLFGPGLWVTTDGGAHWHRVFLSGEVIALAASDGMVFASTETVNGGLNAARLYESKVGTGAWTRVPHVTPQNALTAYGHSVWAGVANGVMPGLWRSTDSGKHWTKLSFHCPHTALSASAVAAASTQDVALACSDQGFPQPGQSFKDVYTSSNGGSTFHLVGHPAEPGQVRVLAMPPGHPKVITLTADDGASYLYRSGNGGRIWQQVTYFDGGLQFRDPAYVSATTGYVIHFGGGPVIAYTMGLMKTVNAGKAWTTVTMP